MKRIKDKYGAFVKDPEAPKQFHETKEFKKLNKKWAKELKKSGFEDAEEFDSPRELMKQHHDHYFMKRATTGTFDDTQRYYELARQLLYTHEFDYVRERKVWELHSEGESTIFIGKKLRITSWIVKQIIKKLRPLVIKDAKKTLEEIDMRKKSND